MTSAYTARARPIEGVRLADVDDDEFDLLSVLLLQLCESSDRRPEGRSCIATEDQRDGPLFLKGGELELLGGFGFLFSLSLSLGLPFFLLCLFLGFARSLGEDEELEVRCFAAL
jgi:hypothetical protein